MTDTWRRLLPVTSFVLEALELKASAETMPLSRPERLLVTACQFWVAVGSKSVANLLGSMAEERLRAAYIAFYTIGAVQVARSLRVMIGECPPEPSLQWLQARAAALEKTLVEADDAINNLIADYALDHISDRHDGTPGRGAKPAVRSSDDES